MKTKLFCFPAVLFIIGLLLTNPVCVCTETKDSYTEFTEDGAWCWFSDPRAVYYEGRYKRTYAGWVDHHGSIKIGYFDHATKEIKVKVIHEKLEKDDHDNPALLITRDGRLMVFYSMHSTKKPIYLQVTKDPEDIEEWESRRELALNDTDTYRGMNDTYTYANVFRLSKENDKIYFFWRGADFKPNYSTSTDGGKTWGKGRILILPERVYKNRRPYFKACSNNTDTIHFAFTDGHPRNEPTNSIYYFKYRCGNFYSADGRKITDISALPLTPGKCDIVYDAGPTGEKAWIWDIAEDRDGRPVLVYVRFPDDNNHEYFYARWDGKKWQKNRIVNSGGWFPRTPKGEIEREPNYSGGIVIDHEKANTVYLSIKHENVFEIEQWTTNDNGKNWIAKSVTNNSNNDNVRPFVVHNMPDTSPFRVLWLNVDKYIHYTDYKSSIKMDLME